MQFKHRKKATLAAFASVFLLAGGTAFAYWTTSGSGSGSASTGNSTPVTVSQVGSIAGLVPGSSSPINFSINNPSSGAQRIGTVTVGIGSVTGPNITGLLPCTADDFTITQPTAINTDIPTGVTSFSPSGASIAMVNSSSNQNGCKDAAITLTFTAA